MPSIIMNNCWFKAGLLRNQCDQQLAEKDLADTDNHENLVVNEAIYDDDHDEEISNGDNSDIFVIWELV